MRASEPAASSRRTLLVGCGKLGTRLGLRLVATGGEVLALRRDTTGLPDAFARLSADLSAPVPRTLIPAVDDVVITLPPGDHDGPEPAYVRSLRHLADALPVVPRRVVLVSSTRVLEGRAGSMPLTEADEPAPASARAAALLDGERLAIDRLDALVVRPAGIYGPGRDMLVRKVRDGSPVQYARRTNRIHETDLVRSLEAMLGEPEPPRLLHAVDARPAPLGEVVSWIAEALGVPPPPRIEPAAPSGTVLRGDRLIALLGRLRYASFEDGYRALLEQAIVAGAARGGPPLVARVAPT